MKPMSAILLAAIFPYIYGCFILWGANHRFRSTTRRWLIAMTLFAVVLGLACAAGNVFELAP
jgi:hypothetical protein